MCEMTVAMPRRRPGGPELIGAVDTAEPAPDPLAAHMRATIGGRENRTGLSGAPTAAWRLSAEARRDGVPRELGARRVGRVQSRSVIVVTEPARRVPYGPVTSRPGAGTRISALRSCPLVSGTGSRHRPGLPDPARLKQGIRYQAGGRHRSDRQAPSSYPRAQWPWRGSAVTCHMPIRLERRTRTLSGPSPDLDPVRALGTASSGWLSAGCGDSHSWRHRMART